MRQLNKKQKKELDRIMNEREVRSVYDLSAKEYDVLERMNDHETLWQNLERYISDTYWERR